MGYREEVKMIKSTVFVFGWALFFIGFIVKQPSIGGVGLGLVFFGCILFVIELIDNIRLFKQEKEQ